MTLLQFGGGYKSLYTPLVYAPAADAGISGWYQPEFIQDVIHNRTVNLKGGKGHNVAMDRVCEFLNAEFKGLVSVAL